MTAERVSIAECNKARFSVFFDANVILDAIRDKGRGPTIENFLRVDPPLRLIASMTLYEVAFSRKGLTTTRLEQNQQWVRDHFATEIPFQERVGLRFERFLRREAHLVRGKTDLADLLLACWMLAQQQQGRGATQLAIATKNEKDFDSLPVRLVCDFLRP